MKTVLVIAGNKAEFDYWLAEKAQPGLEHRYVWDQKQLHGLRLEAPVERWGRWWNNPLTFNAELAWLESEYQRRTNGRPNTR